LKDITANDARASDVRSVPDPATDSAEQASDAELQQEIIRLSTALSVTEDRLRWAQSALNELAEPSTGRKRNSGATSRLASNPHLETASTICRECAAIFSARSQAADLALEQTSRERDQLRQELAALKRSAGFVLIERLRGVRFVYSTYLHGKALLTEGTLRRR
jgi:hypothetical protein